MKRQIHMLLMGTASLFLLGSMLHGQLLVENFEYPAGDELKNHGWTMIRPGTNAITISSPGLEYSGYPLSGIGNAAFLPQNSEEVMKNFTEQTTGSIYVSLLVKVNDASTTDAGYTFLYLGPQNAALFNRYLSLYMRKNQSDQISFGIYKGSGVYCTDFVYALNTTYLIVASYQFNTGSSEDDTLRLWINPPTDGTEPTADRIESWGSDAPSLSEIVLSQIQEDPALTIDGLTVSTTWPIIPTVVPQENTLLPSAFQLYQNSPNPFNPITAIRFDVVEPVHVELVLYDILGRRMRTLTQGRYEQGSYEIIVDVSDLAAGVYVYSIQMGNYRSSKKLVLMK